MPKQEDQAMREKVNALVKWQENTINIDVGGGKLIGFWAYGCFEPKYPYQG